MQLAINFAPAARKTDPITSHYSAEAHTASGKRGHNVGLVIDAVRAHPGHTSAELVKFCGLERHEVARRTSDAEKAGAIVKGSPRHCNTSGRLAVTWWAL